MTTKFTPPLHVWHRSHPAATGIALELLRRRPLLNLTAGLLVSDVIAVYGVSGCTARRAVSMARKNAGITTIAKPKREVAAA